MHIRFSTFLLISLMSLQACVIEIRPLSFKEDNNEKVADTSEAPQEAASPEKEIPLQKRSSEVIPLPQRQISQKTKAENEKLKEVRKSDVKHTVQFEGENLKTISAWYTGTPTNDKTISRLNNMPYADIVPKGTVILVPKYLLINNKPFSQEEFKKIKELY